MTIKEINQLVRDEDNKVLRNPIDVDEYTKGELYMQMRIMDGINYLMLENEGNGLIARCIKKRVMKNSQIL